MQINMEDMRYFVDPVQRPYLPPRGRTITDDAPLIILALRYRRTDLNTSKADKLGKPMAVTYQRVEQHELWWVDADGDHVQGAVMNPATELHRQLMVGMVNDDVFAVGTCHNKIGERYMLSMTRRSDGKSDHPFGPSRAATINVMSAAPWARDLMPATGDTQEVVDQKVMLAKQKYDQRQKKSQIYIEGIQRDWLDLLSQIREAGHDMPRPTFRIGVTGIALINPARVNMDDLNERVQESVTTLQNQIIRPTYGSHVINTYTGVNFAVVTSAHADSWGDVRGYPTQDLSAYTQQALNYSVDASVETSRFPVLSSF